MSLFIPEAFITSLKVALLVSLSWIFIKAYLEVRGESCSATMIITSLTVLLLLFLYGTIAGVDAFYKDLVRRFSGYTFGLLFIVAVFSPHLTISVLLRRPGLMRFLLTLSVILLAGGEVLGLSFFLKDLLAMRQNPLGVYTGAVAGFSAGLLFIPLSRRITKRLSSFMSGTALLFSLSTIKLLFSWTSGYAGFSLLPSVQKGLMKFFHDFVHQLFVFFMVPDHPLLKTTVWNFIGLLFGDIFTKVITLLILIAPPAFIIFRMIKRPEVVPEELKGAMRRRYIHEIMSSNRKKAVPLLLFVLIVIAFWFFKMENLQALYIPQPVPVAEEKGFILLKLKTPAYDLADGYIHKFTLKKDERIYRFFVFKRPDERFAVCLDACEICPPEGYGQAKGHLVCIYCNTPIPFNTVGSPGGCNPIPLNFSLTDEGIKIEVEEILKKWRLVHSGVSKE